MKNKTKIVAGISIAGTIIAGLYFSGQKNYLTWDEYESLVEGYNTKIEEIKSICDTDVRCINENGKKKIIFEGAKTKKDIINKLNLWVKEENNKYDRHNNNNRR